MPRGLRAVAKCSFDGCGRAVGTAWLCAGHYEQKCRGDALRPIRQNSSVGSNAGRCSFDGCRNGAKVGGLCGSHYDLKRSGRGLRPLKHWGTGTSDRDRYLRRAYSITATDYAAMLETQGNVCAACGGVNESGRALAVDHDHACCPESASSCGNCIRGLLCDACNLAAGQARDDANRLRALADYLDRHAARRLSAAA